MQGFPDCVQAALSIAFLLRASPVQVFAVSLFGTAKGERRQAAHGLALTVVNSTFPARCTNPSPASTMTRSLSDSDKRENSVKIQEGVSECNAKQAQFGRVD